jgi:hypothetical protein
LRFSFFSGPGQEFWKFAILPTAPSGNWTNYTFCRSPPLWKKTIRKKHGDFELISFTFYLTLVSYVCERFDDRNENINTKNIWLFCLQNSDPYYSITTFQIARHNFYIVDENYADTKPIDKLRYPEWMTQTRDYRIIKTPNLTCQLILKIDK